MIRALGAKNKLLFVNGQLPIPDFADLNRPAWERCNHLIHSWIINSVTEQIAQTLVFHENCYDVWQDLQERFSKIDRIRIASIRSSINNLKQGSKSVLDYFVEMKALWEELHSHRPIPSCTCIHQCRCDAMRAARNFFLEDQVIQFLTGLNSEFSVVKTQILLMDPLPTLNKVYSLVVQEESNHKSLTVAGIDDSPLLANAADARKQSNRGKGVAPSKNSNRVCTFCGKNNHTVEFCYAKHGHPNVNKGNSAHHEPNGPRTANSVAEEGSSSTNAGLSQVQYDQLVSLLQQANLFASAQSSSNPSPNNASVSNVIHDGLSPHDSSTSGNHSSLNSMSASSYWILDSGANEHICSSSHWFYSLHSIDPISVSLPNGASISVNTAGTIHLTDKISLQNVLYSPKFTINLISISKMCQSLNCCVHFISNKCIIQDTISQKMIGLGDRINGLYRLLIHKSNISSADKSQTTFSHSVSNKNNVTSCNFNSTIIPVSTLWHFRFGHLSNSRLSNMTHLYPNISVDK
jgi:hypothetical protein